MISLPIDSKANEILQFRSGWSFEFRRHRAGQWEVCVLGLTVLQTGSGPEVGGLVCGSVV